MKVLVTGSAGHLARSLLPRLCADGRIARITGIDVKRGSFVHPKFSFVQRDVRDPEVARTLDGVDAVVHLAFVVMQSDLGRERRNRKFARNINVDGSANLARLADGHGVASFVHLSSAAVYALPAAAPLDESHAMGGLPGFGYAQDKIAVEAALDRLEATIAMRIVRLRPHVILGPHALPALRAFLRLPLYPRLPMPSPCLQCVHEEDVSEAIRLALFSNARGAFNIAADDAVPYRDIVRALHPRAFPLPFALVRAAVSTAWTIAGAGTDPVWVSGLRENLVLDTRRAKRELGWQPRYDCISAARVAVTPLSGQDR